MDKTNSKRLCPNEFRQAISDTAGFHLSDQQIEAILKYCHQNQSGEIYYEEFINRLEDR